MKMISKPFKLLFSRTTLAILSFILQIVIIGFFYFLFDKYLVYLIGGITVLNIIIVVSIINSGWQSDFKMSWIIFVLLFPGFGAFFYIFCEHEITVFKIKERFKLLKKDNYKYLPQNEDILNSVKELKGQATYMYKVGHFPIYEAVGVKYFINGETFFPDFLDKLRNAQKFIFLEFFIIANDAMWNTVLDILKEKAQQGVEVRIIYDGTCSFFLLPKNYPTILEKWGIEAQIFSPIVPVLSTHYNNRDHQKIVVIDGIYAYTGGINMANEYINTIVKYGYWKDNMILFSSSAVNSLTVMFLEIWNLMKREKNEDYTPYLINHESTSHDGYIIPFSDDPCTNESIGKTTYIYLLNKAIKSIDIAMPYFVVDEEFLNALFYAVKRGVKVNLVLPGIPDKKGVNYVAKTYYKELIDNGVNVYEFTKGFTHLKIMLRDDEEAVVGTINLDYRSLYLHFEDGVLLYKVKEIKNIKKDYLILLSECQKIDEDYLKKYSKVKLLLGKILRIFGPLL